MRALLTEKEKAIQLRREGASYKDILNEVGVAKSSLSLWLKDLPLTQLEKKALKARKDANISRGRIKAAGVLHRRRLEREAVWLHEARLIYNIHKGEVLFNAGIILYWAEGSKRTTQWSFINSDDDMIAVMLDWLEQYTQYSRTNVRFRLYMHKIYAHEQCESWWQSRLHITPAQFSRTIYKRSGKGIKKRPQYKGCLRIEPPRSKELLMKMKFWQNMLIEQCAKQ